jgi:hypothetical protein
MDSFGIFDFADILTTGKTHVNESDLMNNMSSQLAALQTWTDEIEELRGKIGNTDLFDALQKLGVKSLNEIQAVNRMTDGQLANYVQMYDQKQRMAAALAYSQSDGLVIEEQAKDAEKASKKASSNAGASSGSSSDKEILTKLSGIYERLGRLKMVTETGALVGEIIDEIDDQLSERQRLIARRV